MEINLDNWTIFADDLTLTFEESTYSLEPRAMDLLVYLIENRGKIVSRNSLVDNVWGGIIVSDHAVTACIAKVRKVFSQAGYKQPVIETISKRGYRLNPSISIEFVQNAGQALVTSGNQESVINRDPSKDTTPAKRVWGAFYTYLGLLILSASLTYAFFRSINVNEPNPTQKKFNNVQPVTSLSGSELDPTVSPDGKLLAYLFQQEVDDAWAIHIIDLANTSNRIEIENVSQYTELAWSGDSKKIVFQRNDELNCDLFLATLDVSTLRAEERKLVQCFPHSKEMSFAWKEDSDLIYFNESNSKIEARSIYELNVKTLKKLQLTAPMEVGFGDYGQIYDSETNSLFFLRNKYWKSETEFMLLNLNTRKLDTLFFVEHLVLSHALDENRNHLYQVSKTELIESNSITNSAQIIFSSLTPIKQPTYANAGQSLYFVSEDSQDMDIETLGLTRAAPDLSFINTSRDDFAPILSHNGKMVAYLSNKSGDKRVYIANINNGEIRAFKLGIKISSNRIFWSQDDNTVAINERGVVYTINLNSNDVKSFDLQDQFAYLSGFSKDGSSFYFSSDKRNDWQLYRYTNGAVTQVTDYGGYEAQESEDGRWLYFTKFRENGLWQKDMQTGEESVLVPDIDLLVPGSYQLLGDNIYYKISSNGGFSLMRFTLSSRESNVVAHVDSELERRFNIAPDGSWLAYEKQPKTAGADIMRASR